MAAKLMPLRRDGTCAKCQCILQKSSAAWWNSVVKQVSCTECGPLEASLQHQPSQVPAPTWAPPAPIDLGVGGISAQKEYDRRVAQHERVIEQKWGAGRIGRIAKLLADEPQSTTAWAKGADGERRLARMLTDNLRDAAVVLHDRKVPGTKDNIDHLVIAPTGVWVIDAKNYSGKVELRDVGGWFKSDLRLYVANNDKTKLVDAMAWQVEEVRKALAPIGFGEVPVSPALCFTSSEWGLFAKPFRINGVHVTWAAKLVESLHAPGELGDDGITLVARHLSSSLPASS